MASAHRIIRVNAPLFYPHETAPATGSTLTVAPGVEWLCMPLPFALNHINLWLLADGDGYVAVDTGIALDEVKAAWKSTLTGRHLNRCIVTHFHPDHLGLAGWLEQETGARLWMSQGEYLTAHMIAEAVGSYTVAAMLTFFRRHGLDETSIAALAARGNAYRRGVPIIPASYQRLFADQQIQIGAHAWRTIVGYGHAPEHMSLYCAELKLLISGDMLLPRISTNISVLAATPLDNPLKQFLDSIDALRTLPEDTLVLPSHGRPFRGLHARVAQLEAHHAERCEVLLAACATRPHTAAELIGTLFGREIPDPHQTMFAMGEAIAHLNYLQNNGRMRRIEENGVIRHIASASRTAHVNNVTP
jgi:glyoxylase-like metal-dependent hydrolase (beta-lactamase superfamily II)